MTQECTWESEKLSTMLNTPYFENITTEIMLHTWIGFNGADDIYDCLLSMTLDLDNKHYTPMVKEKLKILKERLKNKGSGK